MPYKTPVYLQKDSKLKNIGSVQPQTTQQMVTNTCCRRARAFESMQIHYRKKWTLQFNIKQIGSITTTFISTPLHFASENGHFEVCKLLIENMVHKNPATLDSDLWTPLHFAARFNHLGICRFLLLCPWFPHKKS